MDIIKKNNLADFTVTHYIRLLKKAKKEYILRTFNDFKKNEKYMIVRHDIDASVEAALTIARAEKKLCIKAVYFILMHSPWYNLMDERESNAVKELLKLGHSVGLHFDAEYYRIMNESDLIKYIKLEKTFLEKVFETKINAFAFHNPTEKTLKYNKIKYAGIINTYALYFRKHAEYSSDSNGHWRHKRLEDVLKSNDGPIQVLTHPIFWQSNPGYPKHKIWNSILGNAERTVKEYDKFLKDRKRKNIGELSDEFLIFKKIDPTSGFLAEKYWIRGETDSAYLKCWKFLSSVANVKRNKSYIPLSKLKDLCLSGGQVNKKEIAGAIKLIIEILKSTNKRK